MDVRVIIWNEHRHERHDPAVGAIYPHGIHGALEAALRRHDGLDVSTATLDQDAEHGLTEARLADTDVLVWWGHLAHGEVRDDVAERVVRRVWAGMGLVVLHSGHFSKPFKRLMGTSCDLKWRVGDDREILWVVRPGHPLVRGIDADHVVIDREEMYGEFFDVPQPDETVMISSFTGGEVFRSLCTWQRGAGRVVYFRPGHETFPTYHDATVQRVIANAVRWAAADRSTTAPTFGERKSGWLGASS